LYLSVLLLWIESAFDLPRILSTYVLLELERERERGGKEREREKEKEKERERV
jgi:hypothetical protein